MYCWSPSGDSYCQSGYNVCARGLPPHHVFSRYRSVAKYYNLMLLFQQAFSPEEIRYLLPTRLFLSDS